MEIKNYIYENLKLHRDLVPPNTHIVQKSSVSLSKSYLGIQKFNKLWSCWPATGAKESVDPPSTARGNGSSGEVSGILRGECRGARNRGHRRPEPPPCKFKNILNINTGSMPKSQDWLIGFSVKITYCFQTTKSSINFLLQIQKYKLHQALPPKSGTNLPPRHCLQNYF